MEKELHLRKPELLVTFHVINKSAIYF